MNRLFFKGLLGGLLLAAWLQAGAQEGITWRKVDPANVVLVGMPDGEIVIELNPAFAPETVAHFRKLVIDDFYRGLSFYRVIDGFVAQAGDESDISDDGVAEGLTPEFERRMDEELPWTRVQRDDMFAPETGFIDGFTAARDGDEVWLTHCPGIVAMARGTEADSGSTDFYIVIGQAPRYLDRNLTVFGRVIAGMEVAQKINRGPTESNGIIENELARTRIGRMRLASMVDELDRRDFYVMDTSNEGFQAMVEARRKRNHEWFFHKPPRVLDVCQIPVGTRIEASKPSSRRVRD